MEIYEVLLRIDWSLNALLLYSVLANTAISVLTFLVWKEIKSSK